MRITLNGQKKNISGSLTLNQLIEKFCANPRHVVVEVNGKIIKTSLRATTPVRDGDRLELVSIVGGG